MCSRGIHLSLKSYSVCHVLVSSFMAPQSVVTPAHTVNIKECEL